MPPLTRDRMTAASLIMLPTYPLMYGTIGVLSLVEHPDRTSTPMFDVAKLVAPITLWGALFAAVAAFELLALLTHRRQLYAWVLIPGAGLAAFWTVLLLAAAIASPLVSFTDPVWTAGMCIAQAASARSLARAERDS